MFGDNSVLAEISQAIDKVNNAMRKTSDPAKLASLEKDMEVLRNEYRAEINCLYGI